MDQELGEEGVLFWVTLHPSLSPGQICSSPPPPAHDSLVPSVPWLLLCFWLPSCILSDLALVLLGVLPLGVPACIPNLPVFSKKPSLNNNHLYK